jgi:hypothetical protein
MTTGIQLSIDVPHNVSSAPSTTLRRHGSFSFFHVWKKYHGDEFTNRCPFCCFRHNLCYLILLKASSQWGGHPILGFLLDTLW